MSIGSVVERLIVWGTVSVLVFNGCSTINIIKARLSELVYIDSMLIKYSDRFIAEAKKRNHEVDVSKLTMVFGTTGTKDSPTTVGTCSDIGEYPIIIVDKLFWETASEERREELVFHEMGHCILGRDHCEVKNNGMSVSIMEPEMLNGHLYQNSRTELLNELFDPVAECESTGVKPSSFVTIFTGL